MKTRILYGLIIGSSLVASATVISFDSKTDTANNLKHMSTGMLIYCADYDDVLPYVLESKTAMAVIFPYVKDRQSFKSLNPGSHFGYNISLGGVNLTDIPSPKATVLFYDAKAWADGSHLAATTDAEVKAYDAKQWAALSKSLKSKISRTAVRPLPKDYYKKLYPQIGF
jgi:hypothetical protein